MDISSVVDNADRISAVFETTLIGYKQCLRQR
jgi:hypothetical protein